MQEYTSKTALIDEIRKTAEFFIKEFDDVSEDDKDLLLDGVDRTPREILAYQLGWMDLIRGWDKDELDGKEVVTPAPGYKWNQMGALYQGFYDRCKDETIFRLKTQFAADLDSFTRWLNGFNYDELFKSGGRKWAASTASNWPIWKWVHINTVAPFKSFRSKIRKWKKLRA
jgi:hypothetical protein